MHGRTLPYADECPCPCHWQPMIHIGPCCVPRDYLGADPLVVRVTSLMGPRKSPITGQPVNHNGTDYAVPSGTPIIAIADGTIEQTWLNHNVNGTALTVNHESAGLPYQSSYVHLSGLRGPGGERIDGSTPASTASTLAAALKGRKVRRGELLGWSGGAKGAWGAGRSTGPHLHLTLKRRDGKTWTAVESVDLIDWSGIQLSRR